MAIRSYDHPDPQALVRALGDDPGLALVERVAAGALPGTTMASTLGMRLVHAAPGKVRYELTSAAHLANVMGTLHGGAIASLCDAACGFAVISTLAPHEWFTTMDLTTKMLRASALDGSVICARGEVLRRGRRTAVAEARVFGPDGKLMATALSSCLILDRESLGLKAVDQEPAE